MSQEPKAERIWEEGEVASSEALHAAAAGADVETWRDSILIASLFDFNGLARAIHVITQAGGLGYLLSMSTPDLLGLGLSPVEAERFERLPALASHLLAFRYKGADPSTRRELANELAFRGVQAGWREDRFGIVGWAPDGHRVLDSALPSVRFGRGPQVESQRTAQMILRAGATVVTLWRWSPYERIAVTQMDQSFSDEIRILGAALNFCQEDYLIICPRAEDSISLAVLQQWPL